MFCITACGKSKVEFKVNFVVDGEIYATLNTSGEEIIKMPENPTKDDYDFDGWYWDKDTWQTPFTANSLLDAPLSSDMNVYCKWKPKTVRVSGISLNKSEVSLRIDETEILTATITPANATDTNVLWESSNASAVAVENGKLTATRYGASVQSQQVKEDHCATAPASPSKIGYTFMRRNFDFTKEITQDTEIKAVWTANTDTKYKTEYYLQNLENDAYTLHETSNSQGTTDTTANAEIKNLAHFTHKASATDSGNIAPDGSLILKVYYARDKYNVVLESNGGALKSGKVNQILKYEGSAVAPVFTRTGYTFIGWDKNFSSVNSNIILFTLFVIPLFILLYISAVDYI